MIVQRDQVCRNYTGAEKVTVDKWEEMGIAGRGDFSATMEQTILGLL
jgi:hypothetical protein